MFDDNATPTRISGVDIDELAETPTPDEFFLYSRIDGNVTVGELCSTSGLGRDETLEALQGLLEVGLIDVPGASRADFEGAESSDIESTHTAPQSEASEAAGDSDSSEASESPDESPTGIDLSYLPVSPSEFEFDEDLLERDLPIEIDKRRELLCIHDQLDDIDYYQFFGLEADASAREIKRAYFKLSKRYHPDKYFREELGPFSEILEEVFQHVTRSYRVLSEPEKRRAYDRELAETREMTDESKEATPMNQPSSIGIAREETSEESGDADDSSGPGKREAAFRVLVRRGEKARENDRIVRAAEQFRKALRIKRDIDIAERAAEMLLDAETRLDQAKLFARAALRIDKEDPDAHVLAARVFEALDHPERALEYFERALERDEGHDEARRRRDELQDDQ